MDSRTMRVIFDCDASTDDFMALALLASHPEVQLLAVTLAATGEAHAQAGVRNVADICHLLNLTDMPIAAGSSLPCAPHAGFPESFRSMIDALLANIAFDKNPRPNYQADAVELMHQILEKGADTVTIVATGPLTNVANLVEKYPHLKAKIADVVIMGGAVRVPGNIKALDPSSTNEVAEWNIYADPKAAQMVLNSGVKVTLVPLDATNQVPFTKEFYNAMSLQQQPALKVIYQLLKQFVDVYGDETFNIYYLWDALAAMIAVDKTLAGLEHLSLRVDLASGATCLNKANDAVPNAWVATSVAEPGKVLDKLLESLKANLLRPRLQVGLGHSLLGITATASQAQEPVKSLCRLV